jgi:hypothetical protein
MSGVPGYIEAAYQITISPNGNKLLYAVAVLQILITYPPEDRAVVLRNIADVHRRECARTCIPRPNHEHQVLHDLETRTALAYFNTRANTAHPIHEQR